MWTELRACCHRAEQIPGALNRQRLVYYRATAYCALGEEAAMNAAMVEYIATFPAVLPDRMVKREAYFRKQIRQEAGLEEVAPVSDSATNSP